MMQGLRTPLLGEGTVHYCRWMGMPPLGPKILQVRFSHALKDAIK